MGARNNPVAHPNRRHAVYYEPSFTNRRCGVNPSDRITECTTKLPM